MLNKIRETVKAYLNKNIKLRINNIRNKSEIVEGKIIEIYERFFVFECKNSIKLSFNYSDILTKNVEKV